MMLKKVSLIRKMIVIFSKYIMIEIVTVSVLKGWNQKGECFSKPRRRQTFFEGESISRKMRYIKDKLSFFLLCLPILWLQWSIIVGGLFFYPILVSE